jgi:Ser/Thr protein kinase RdoA (MazF antagonist)
VQISTHDLTVGMSEVSKRFDSWQRGEAAREWEALKALAGRAPGLAARPLRRTVEAGRPVVVMSRLPGMPLGDRPLSPPQVMAVADALTELHRAVPAAELHQVPRRIWHPAEAVETLRAWAAEQPPNLQGDVRHAFMVGAEWIHSAEACTVACGGGRQVLGQGDGNIANFLWDGERCRLVDFEDCGLSDQAFEIADLVEHLSVWLRGARRPQDGWRHGTRFVRIRPDLQPRDLSMTPLTPLSPRLTCGEGSSECRQGHRAPARPRPSDPPPHAPPKTPREQGHHR